ncbi:MAG TPA: hypothetical protein PKA82_08050 [Pyrinomonadaceae bacterium]|nr:hypothetical protein [Pyrinomonadaceae bacterium]
MLSVCVFGQKGKTAPDTTSAKPTESNERSIAAGTSIEGQLQSTINVKKAKVGDEVVLKTARAITQNGKTLVSKGSILIGRVTEVVERTSSINVSRLSVIFDRIRSGGLSSPISVSISSIASASNSASIGDTAGFDSMMGSSPTASAGRTGSNGGGLLGGVTGTAGGVLGSTTNVVSGVGSTVGNTVQNTTGSVGRSLGNIKISNSVNGSISSGTSISAADRNIRLEKGLTMTLQLNDSVNLSDKKGNL